MNVTELQLWTMIISLAIGLFFGHYFGFMRAIKKLEKNENQNGRKSE